MSDLKYSGKNRRKILTRRVNKISLHEMLMAEALEGPQGKMLGDHAEMQAVELFSGAGGLALGLEQAGFQSLVHVERDHNGCATLRKNRPGWNVVESDIQGIDYTELRGVTLVAGGPPCQPFSMGGKARGREDCRDMFPEAVRAVRELHPRAFIFENVRGLLRPAFRNYVEFIRLQLTYPEFPISGSLEWEQDHRRLQKHHTTRHRMAGLQYRVSIHTANAADYGVPQRRHRVFFIGFRDDLNARWSFPHVTHTPDQLIFDQYVSGEYWERHRLQRPSEIPSKLRSKLEQLRNLPMAFAQLKPWVTVRDALEGLPHPRIVCDFRNHRFQPGARAYPGHTGSLFDEPAKALKAGDHGVPGGENMLRYPNGKVRYFTVRESARLQTFPDDYSFHGSWTESMRQLGNAVPVRLACIVAGSVASCVRAHGRSNLQST